MMKNVKLKNRLLISFSVILILTVLISALALNALKNANEELNVLIAEPLTADSAVKMCRIETNVAARTLRNMAIDENANNNQSYKEKINISTTAIKDNLQVLKNSYKAQNGLVEKYEKAMTAWIGISDKIVSTIESGDREKAFEMILNDCTPALQGLIDIAKEIDVTTVEMKTQALAKSQRDTNVSSIIVLTLLIAAIAAGISISIKTTAGIVRPLREVQNAAEQMAKGYLNSSILNTSRDEVGQLAESMRSSMQTLAEYISDIDRNMEEMAKGNFNVHVTKPFIGDFKHIEDSITKFAVNISNTLLAIQQFSDTVDNAAGQVSSSSQALAQGATEQAGEVETLSASIDQIAVQVTENAKNAGIANDLSGNVANEIANSDEKMKHLIVAMGEISGTSKEIGKIIKAIEDIAFQTNILALNAAVEAARAGAAGKGFAVVADEVRNLAAKSAEAAKNTTELIQSSVKAVANGTELADDTAKAMELVVTGAKQITDLIEKISEASNEQAASSQKISAGIDQIAAVIQTNSATAEESAAASEELSGQAQTLKSLVSRFNLLDTEKSSKNKNISQKMLI